MVRLRETRAESDGSDKAERLGSLDAARGLFLLLLISSGFGLRDPQMVSQDRWGWMTNQWTQRAWEGCTLWDLLQPALLFIAGVAMPYSYANRQAKGQNWIREFAHALKRAGLLLLLGLYLDSYRESHLVFDLRGDLQQIALAYLLAFLILPLGMPVRGVTIGFLLIGHTAAYVIYAFASKHELWDPTQNLGAALDRWMHFAPHRELDVTFNAVSAAAIVLLGTLISGLIRSGLTPGSKIAIMTVCGLSGIISGWLFSGGNGWIAYGWYPIIPMIRPLATWTFVFTAVGWTLLVFTYFYLVIDGFLLAAWAAPLAVLGRNSLFLFVTFVLFREWAVKSALLVLSIAPPSVAALRPLFVELIVVAIYWLICFWLYWRRIFLKL
jgi:heparan-alpha-glucosaminide N-acetyltransferase